MTILTFPNLPGGSGTGSGGVQSPPASPLPSTGHVRARWRRRSEAYVRNIKELESAHGWQARIDRALRQWAATFPSVIAAEIGRKGVM